MIDLTSNLLQKTPLIRIQSINCCIKIENFVLFLYIKLTW